MGRPLRPTSADVVYHVLNRANARRTLFDDGDFAAFERVLGQACEHVASSGEHRRPCRRLAVVECAAPGRTTAWSTDRSRTRRATGAVAQLGERLDDGGRGATDPAECQPGCAIRISGMDGRHRVAPGTRCEPPTDRTIAEIGGNVECPRCSSPIPKSQDSC